MPRRRAPPQRLRLHQFLPYNLSVLSAKVAARLALEYQRAVGLQLPEARVMTVLGNFAPVSSNAVVHHTSMDKATVSRAIGRLIQIELVSRMPDPRDRRLLVLGFTPKGKRTYRRLTQVARAWDAWFTEQLAAADRARLKRILVKLAHRLNHASAFKPTRAQRPLARNAASRPASNA